MTNEQDNDPQEWETYLQVFLDESDEDLESLVQALLRLEDDPHDLESLNEAFRLLHTHKGSAGLMGFDAISELAHELENRFEQFRSGEAVLDATRITVLLKCVDFLRSFNTALRAGQTSDQDTSHLLKQLAEFEKAPHIAAAAPEPMPIPQTSLQGAYRIRVEFEAGLQLADMKARLIVARLSDVGEIIATEPPVDDIQSVDLLSHFVLVVLTNHDPAEVRKIANVDGVHSVVLEGGPVTPVTGNTVDGQESQPVSTGHDPATQQAEETDREAGPASDDRPSAAGATNSSESEGYSASSLQDAVPSGSDSPETESPLPQPDSTSPQAERAAVAQTVRVDVDRLDALMNLTGELVVTKARLVQITGEMNAVFRGQGMSRKARELGERCHVSLSRIKELLATRSDQENGWQDLLSDLGEDLSIAKEQFDAWEESRRHFTRIAESVDQLSRVSGNLQQSVLDTRMVPLAPLFNRFRRVIRDLAGERNKQVLLAIHGEKTELDKRMIDELGDPLLHLVRNSLDHGLELPAERRRLGKPETGTIVMEAAHSGNNVLITIRDDGAGLNIERIQQRILDCGLSTETALAGMTEQQIMEHIWLPGFTTADRVTDISGRGVGMDVVKNRLAELNGSIEVESEATKGTSFKLRLPLTLAIVRCLLVRFRAASFSMPIDHVREIVAVGPEQVHSVHGNQTIDVRGEFIPLLRMDHVFYWHDIAYQSTATGLPVDREVQSNDVDVVILQAAGRTIGLCVDELFGSADIVIKSLSDNFVNIRGLSGASIMGDGSVCLMLDTNEIVEMVTEGSRSVPASLAN